MCFEIQLQRIVSVLFIVATTSAAADQPKQLQLHGSKLMLSVNLQHRPYQVEHKHSDSDDLQVKYEETIATCLGRIHQHLEVCVQEFNHTYEERWLELKSTLSEEQKIRNFCCIQNDFKECWVRAIGRVCTDQERPLSRWLPVMVLKDLRNDSRCSNYVLYPHKCRDNLLSLWQILSFLIVVPFVTSFIILGLILYLFPSVFLSKSASLCGDNGNHQI